MAKRKKVKRFVIDVNSFITLFINREFDWLLQYILQNKLEIFIDSNLLNEMSRVLDYPRIRKLLPLDKHFYLDFVSLISTQIKADSHQVESPDKEDNYLYNIALTANAKLLVTGEKALLKRAHTPVETINLTAFKELF